MAILSITGKEFKMEKIRLRTVRPFVMKEIVLSEEPQFSKKASDKSKEAVMKFLREQVPSKQRRALPQTSSPVPRSRAIELFASFFLLST